MNFTLDQLRAFLAVAQTGGVHRAAESLNLTQPAVTARIKSLEDSIGTTLFNRSDKMALTRRGALLVDYAEQFLALTDLVERDVFSDDGLTRVFRVGASETIVQTWLPNFIQNLNARFPKVSIEIDVADSISLRDRLLANGIDLGLMMGPVSDYRVENVILPRFEMAWFCSPNYSKQAPSYDSPVITFSRTTRPYRELKQLVLERYGQGVPFFPSTSLSAGFRMVAMGLGIGALPITPAKPHLEAGAIQRMELDTQPSPLEFSASFVAGFDSVFCRRAADIAKCTAESYQ